MPDEQAQDDTGSEIWIGMDNPINPNVVGDRPAVTILRGPGGFQGVGLNDMAYIDHRTGGIVRMDILPVTVTINALSRIPLEAEGLAWFAAKHIWIMREEIIKNEEGIMFLGNRLSVSPPTPAGSLVGPDTEHNWVVCSTSIPAYLQTSMTKIPLVGSSQGGPILDRFEVNMATAAPTLEGSQAPEPLQGTAINQPKIQVSGGSVDPAEITPSLPPGGEDEGQSSEPLEVRIIVDKETT
jgi:hypothetical protein